MSDSSYTMRVLFFQHLASRVVMAVLISAFFVIGGCGGGAGSGASGAGKVTLHWDSPTMNADGSTLNDLAGFRVYYGGIDPLTKENAKQVKVDKASTSQSIEGLSPGTYFFAVTAIDTSGNESDFSQVVSTEITEA